jgi:cytochrome c556
MAMSAALLGTIKLATERGAAADTQAYQASGLSRWARALPAMFPPGSGMEAVSVPTRARIEIWSQRAVFEKSSNDLIAATAKLLEFAKDKDTTAFKGQIAVVHDACESCHQAFMKK